MLEAKFFCSFFGIVDKVFGALGGFGLSFICKIVFHQIGEGKLNSNFIRVANKKKFFRKFQIINGKSLNTSGK